MSMGVLLASWAPLGLTSEVCLCALLRRMHIRNGSYVTFYSNGILKDLKSTKNRSDYYIMCFSSCN